MKQGLTLGLLPPRGGSLTGLRETGQHERFLGQYLSSYAKVFSRTLYFSYVQETLDQFTSEYDLLANVRVLPGNRSRLYSFRMPFLWDDEMRQCDVFRVFQTTGVIPALLAKLRWGIPFAVTYGYRYGYVARVERRYLGAMWLSVVERIGLRLADAVIVTTSALMEHVCKFASADCVHLIPNSVDTERFVPAPRLPGNRTMVFVGRLEPQKNLMMLLQALTRLSSPARLVVVGDGSQHQSLVDEAERLNVSLQLLGVLPHAELPPVLGRADAFVLPSLAEGHPKALLEAMSCGLPCVGLDVPGTRDVIAHERTGLLCAPTPDGLAQGLDRVLGEQSLAEKLGRSARVWVEKEFGAERLMSQEVCLLGQLAEEHRR